MECIFCRIVAGDIPARIVHRSESAMAFHDVNPQAPVHVLVIPTQHASTAAELAAAPGGDRALVAVLRLAVEVAETLGIAEAGYRLVANTGRHGGQTVDHLHIHLLGGRQMHWPPG